LAYKLKDYVRGGLGKGEFQPEQRLQAPDTFFSGLERSGVITNAAFTEPVHLEQATGHFCFTQRRHARNALVFKGNRYQSLRILRRCVEKCPVVFEKSLMQAVLPFAARYPEGLLATGMYHDVCFCLGGGKNFEALSHLNAGKGFFGEIIPLPYPRFIIQDRRKSVEQHLEAYLLAFLQSGSFF
jgi:hypothetical protein